MKKIIFNVLKLIGLTPIKYLNDKQRDIEILRDANKCYEKFYSSGPLFNGATGTDKTKLKEWSKRIRETGACDICGDTENLTAHHLWDKKTHPTLALQDENGVCLCDRHHRRFHSTYTSKSHTTPKMYNKYKIMIQNEIQLSKGNA